MISLRNIFVVALVLATLAGSGPAAAVPSEQGSAPAITLRVQTPAYTLDAAGLTVPGYGRHQIPGAPALPIWAATVELPPDGGWTLSYTAEKPIILTVPAALPAVPVPDYKSVRASFPDFVPTLDRPDPAIYAVDAFYPAAPAQAEELGWQAGRRFLAVRVFPFQYNPVRGELRYLPDVRVTVLPTPPAPPPDEGRGGETPPSLPWQGREGGWGDERGVLRIRTAGRGLHRLTWNDLAAAGVPVTTTDPATFAMSYLGQPVDIQVTGEADGRFDPGDLALFYAEPYVGRYLNHNVYWLSWGGPAGPRMTTRAVAPTGSEPLVTAITQTLHVEYDRDYRPLYDRPRDADHWFDKQIYPSAATPTVTVPYTLTLDDPLRTGDLLLTAVFFGGQGQSADPDQSVALRLNAHPIGVYQWDGSTAYTVTATLPAAWLDGSPDRLTLEAALTQLPGLSYYWVSPDWVEVYYAAQADAENDRIYIEAAAAGPKEVAVSGFTTDTVKVYDVTDGRHPVQLTNVTAAQTTKQLVLIENDSILSGTERSSRSEVEGCGLDCDRSAGSFDSGAAFAPPQAQDAPPLRMPAPLRSVQATYTLHFWDSIPTDPAYYLAADAGLLAPLAIEPVTPSTWGASANRADYIAIVHRSLWDAIQPLLDYRAAEGLAVAKVDVQDIYDEFSYGRRDPEAIRGFLGYAYRSWQRPAPQYVLLVGDGHYDFTGVSGTTLLNLIPPYLVNVDAVQGETPADNRFVSVDGPDDYLPEMHVGRISAQTPANVTAVVNKIIAYETSAPAGDWQRRTVFVADNCTDPAGDFNAASEEIRTGLLPTGYISQTIYYGAPADCPKANYTTGAEMRRAITTTFNSDAFMLQWVGHASRIRWGSVSMFNIYDLPTLTSNDVWPLTFSYSCISGYFVNIEANLQSLGETLVNTASRGAVADFSPAGFHILPVLEDLNRTVVRAILQDRISRMGPAMDAAKLAFLAVGGQSDVADTYILFGDPALKLRLPPLPATPTFFPRIETGRMKLSWTHLPENTGYQVWRSERPYFTPGDPDATLAADVPAPVTGLEVSYTDPFGGLGDVAHNYVYAVRGVNPLGVSTVDRRVGDFDYSIIP